MVLYGEGAYSQGGTRGSRSEVVGKAFPEEGQRGPVEVKGCTAVGLMVGARMVEPDPLGPKPICGLLAA